MPTDIHGPRRALLTTLLALGLVLGATFAAPAAVRADSHLEPRDEETGEEEGPQPTLFADVNTSADFFAALEAGGYGPLALQEIGVLTPWIPVVSDGILILEGASVEVYSMTEAEAEAAIGNITGDDASFQPPTDATVWRGPAFILILQDAPNQAAVEALITSIVGPPALATIAGPLPPPPPDDDGAGTDAPVALPIVGSGGLADGALADGGGSVPLWIIVMAAVLAGAGLAGALRLETTRRRG